MMSPDVEGDEGKSDPRHCRQRQQEEPLRSSPDEKQGEANPQKGKGALADDGVEESFLRLQQQDEPVVDDDAAEDNGEEEDSEADGTTSTDRSSKLSKDERRNRRALQKLGMEPVTGVHNVIMKYREGNRKDPLCILKPDVFKFPGLESYAIFGHTKAIRQSNTMPQAEAGQLQLLVDNLDYLCPHGSAELTDEDEYDSDDARMEPRRHQACDDTGGSPTITGR